MVPAEVLSKAGCGDALADTDGTKQLDITKGFLKFP